MTSRLTTLRLRLARLKRARRLLRYLAAWSALASAVVLALLTIFALDLVFELAVPQRLVVLAIALAAVGWTFWKFTLPLLGHRETEIDMALLVERQQQIDSDLVAALQFERPEAAGWGSPQLTSAVVEYVAAAGPAIKVYEGFSIAQAARRGLLLGASLAAALIVVALYPAHVNVFAGRLLLGSTHYPTRTRIEQIVVNHAAVLTTDVPGSGPVETKAPQSRPLTFLVQCAGQLPSGGIVNLTAASGSHERTRLTLKALTLDQRKQSLADAIGKLNDAIQNTAGEILPAWRGEILTLVRFDAPDAVEPLLAAKQPPDLATAASAVARVLDRWPASSRQTAILAGELSRLNEDLSYKIAAGDAWSDAALVRMIPLPQIELELAPLAPNYAAHAAPKPDASGRQLAVLEGSSVNVTLKCTNRKPLTSAWLTLEHAGTKQRIELVQHDADRLSWSVKAGASPLAQIHEELRYEAQVIDADDLSLETPIRGTIRIRPDQPPTGVAEVVHKVVLPTAAPVVAYRASDDYGISGLAVVVDIQRGASSPTAQSAPDESSAADHPAAVPAAAVATESHRFVVPAIEQPIVGERLPLAGSHAIALPPLKLAKGDRIKLTLEVTDYRGENGAGQPIGKSQLCDPVVLEISDESGVLAAISQPDQRSAEQLSEIIKRQLGIGEEL
jgi:hypothetical protein